MDVLDGHIIVNALDNPPNQFRAANLAPQRYRNHNLRRIYHPQFNYPPQSNYYVPQPSRNFNISLEGTVMIEAYGDWRNNQPTYEENLELEERMGRVGSRLSEETIMGHLKIKSYDATSKRMDEEADICVICQSEYEKGEFIGGLQCRHEYHVECVKRWLQQHNSCPICKAAAVSPIANHTRKDLPRGLFKS